MQILEHDAGQKLPLSDYSTFYNVEFILHEIKKKK